MARRKAIVRWRTQADHHAAQEKGRFEVFEDYHLRVGEITVDTAAPKGRTLQEQRFDATDVGEAKVVTITEVVLQEDNSLGAEVDQLAAHLDLRISSEGLMDQQAFESIYRSGKFLLVAAWREADAAKSWSPTTRYGTPRIALRYPPLLREQERGLDDAISVRHRHVRIIRDYGMFDRRETPQFFPEVKRVGREAGVLVGSTRGRP